jgi:anti-sigma regulatory factor (Ser/Thr protein kinase)
VGEFLAASTPRIGRDLIDDVVTCASEVVTNALMHTKSRVVTIRVVALLDADCGTVVTATIGDADSTMPVLRSTEQEVAIATTGRGLPLLTALSCWGCTPRDGGKDVWFICPPPAPLRQA